MNINVKLFYENEIIEISSISEKWYLMIFDCDK